MFEYRENNRSVWNRFVERGSQFARTATDEECRSPLKTLDSRGWLPDSVDGAEVLCLAAGGGWQSILYASAGANVTVVDISDSMLALDVREADRRGLTVRVIQGSMDRLDMLNIAAFDIVHQPVSTCYVPDIRAVYREVSRVLRPNGLYLSQHKQPTSAQITHRNRRNRFVIGIEYYHEGALPQVEDTSYREDGAKEFLHRWEDLVGGLCENGMSLIGLSEPRRGQPQAPVGHYGFRGRYIPPYVRLLARRNKDEARSGGSIWLP